MMREYAMLMLRHMIFIIIAALRFFYAAACRLMPRADTLMPLSYAAAISLRCRRYASPPRCHARRAAIAYASCHCRHFSPFSMMLPDTIHAYAAAACRR